ncbi:MAG TPA: hypothetical protein VGN68_04395 [Sphingopyxis sp.]|jgi:hypothetical protein|uniref:hypothetical protein n=1 Tax=Sphingopyxis sp. TaxID=1908224 RepID=UPI002E15426D|nr:hypothetical protein [Sphingopyxis sp.]
MNLRALFRRREPVFTIQPIGHGRFALVTSDAVPDGVAQGLAAAWSASAPVTCAEAGRSGNIVRHDRERAKIRAATIALAEKIGRPDLADPLR